jgi:hypothetical protein
MRIDHLLHRWSQSRPQETTVEAFRAWLAKHGIDFEKFDPAQQELARQLCGTAERQHRYRKRKSGGPLMPPI